MLTFFVAHPAIVISALFLATVCVVFVVMEKDPFH